MRPEVISIVVLVALFVAGTALPVNLGALGFSAAFLVGAAILHMAPAEIIAEFPGDLFLMFVGITYLFGIAHTNGTIDRLVNGSIRFIGGLSSAFASSVANAHGIDRDHFYRQMLAYSAVIVLIGPRWLGPCWCYLAGCKPRAPWD